MTGSTVCCGLRRDGANGVRVLAPAKVNLTLDVFGQRPDGFHALASLVVGVALYDALTLTARPAGSGIELRCDRSELPTNSENLVWQAAKALAETTGRSADVRIELTKRIPWGAGLGGGSSDAAATLAGLNALWDCGLDGEALGSVGSRIGSDVPLFFYLPAAFMRGRGELVERVECRRSHVVLLILPDVQVSTREVYAQHASGGVGGADQGLNWAELLAGPTENLSEQTSNGLEPAVFRTSGAVKALFEETRGRGLKQLRVSGSGSAMYGLFEEEEKAQYWSRCIGDQAGVKTLVTRTLTSDDYC